MLWLSFGKGNVSAVIPPFLVKETKAMYVLVSNNFVVVDMDLFFSLFWLRS